MASKYYYTARIKDDNGHIIKDLMKLMELYNDNKTLGEIISFKGVLKNETISVVINENPFDIYIRIVNAMDELRKKDIYTEGTGRYISKDYYMCCKRVRYNCNIAFDIEAYYDGDSFALLEFQIYLKRKGKYEDCCTLPSYFGEQQEKALREFVNMYID